MKKLLFVSLCLGLLAGLTSCQKEVGGTQEANATSTLTVTIPQNVETRAVADYGKGAQVNRCILEIYHDGKLYGERQVQSVTDNQVTFSNLPLVASQTYDFVLWADCGDNLADNYYNTSDLSTVTVKKTYTGNDDGFDAFYKKATFQVTSAFSENITLQRPFGQLVVKTNDLAAIQHDELKPTDVQVSFPAVPTTFNVLTGEVSGSEALTYTVGIVDATTGELTVDYILATPAQADLADFSMTFLKADGSEITTNENFRNVPIRRNYRTNVSGNLVTKQGDLVVTIDPQFEQPDIKDYPELRAVLANGGSYTLSEDLEITAPLVMDGDQTVDIDLNGYDIVNKTSLLDGQYGNTTVFEVKGNATLNIKGEGNVQAIGTKPNEDGYRMAVYAYGNAKVNIYGGNFFNDQDYNNHQAQLDLIYADHNAVINIYGGKFESASANDRGYWVLNLKDNSSAAINVYGGTFVNFDPSSSMTENPVKNFVVSTSSAVKISDSPAPNGTYEVVQGIGVGNMEDLQKAIQTLSTQGGEVVIVKSADLDISALGTTLAINYPTTITIDGRLTSNDEAVYLLNNSQLTLKGSGRVDMARRVVENHGTLTVEGGTYTTSVNNGGTVFWNNDPNAVMTLNDVTVDADFYAVAGSGAIQINGGTIKSTSSNKYGAWAYCIRAQEGGTMTIKDAVVEGVQGCIASIEKSHITLDNVQVFARNSEPGKQDAFYALYAASYGVIEVLSGTYYSDRTPCAYASDDDIGAPLGGFVLKGGQYSSYPLNDDGTIWQPEAGYRYAETGDDTYPYAIVME